MYRVLKLLGEFGIPATFYVPGHTADTWPEVVPAILAAGHEVAHHGYLHLGTDELERGRRSGPSLSRG